jgi:hypothetical protein
MLATVIGWQGGAAAAPVLIDVFSGNDRNTIDNAFWEGLGLDPSPFLAEIECDNDLCDEQSGNDGLLSADDFTVEVDTLKDDEEAIGGTWSFDGDPLVRYMAVKAGDFFALYSFDDGLVNNSSWTTGDISVGANGNQPGLSHLSFYDTGENGNGDNGNGGNGGNGTPVPAPTPLLLMAAGLLGLGWASRRAGRA